MKNHLIVQISIFILTGTFRFLLPFSFFFLFYVALFKLTGTFLRLMKKMIRFKLLQQSSHSSLSPHSCKMLHRTCTWLLLSGLSLATGFFGGWRAMIVQGVETHAPISNKERQFETFLFEMSTSATFIWADFVAVVIFAQALKIIQLTGCITVE